MKLFIAVVLAACSFAVHAENGDFLSAKNIFDFKNAINPRDVFVKDVQKYTENLFDDALKYLDATFDEVTEAEFKTESDLSGFAELVQIELDGSLNLAESRLEELAEKDDVAKECARKYNKELEDALVNGRRELEECIAHAVRQGREVIDAIRPAGREIVRLLNEVKALVENCWRSNDNLYEAIKCVFAKGDEINEKLKKVGNIYKEIHDTVQEKAAAIIAEGRKCIGGVASHTYNKIQEIVNKVEQCIAEGQNPETSTTTSTTTAAPSRRRFVV